MKHKTNSAFDLTSSSRRYHAAVSDPMGWDEAELEASERSTTPTNPEGDPRSSRPGKHREGHPDSGHFMEPWSCNPGPRPTGMILPTQPIFHSSPPSLDSNGQGCVQAAAEVRRVKNPRPVAPPPPWPIESPPGVPQQNTNTLNRDPDMEPPEVNFGWDSRYSKYYRQRSNRLTRPWEPDSPPPNSRPAYPGESVAHPGNGRYLRSPAADDPHTQCASTHRYTSHCNSAPTSPGGYRYCFSDLRTTTLQKPQGDSGGSTVLSSVEKQPDVLPNDQSISASGNAPRSPHESDHGRFTLRGARRSTFEHLDPRYQVRTGAEAKQFFKVGRVFAMLWTESGGQKAAQSFENFPKAHLPNGKTVYTSIRRFVVVQQSPAFRQNPPFCYAVPITSYTTRGTTKRHEPAREHSIAYSSRTEFHQESTGHDTTKTAIRINMVPDEGDLPLDFLIHYGSHYKIQHGAKVKEIGSVFEEDIPSLISNWTSAGAKKMIRAQELWKEAHEILFHQPHECTDRPAYDHSHSMTYNHDKPLQEDTNSNCTRHDVGAHHIPIDPEGCRSWCLPDGHHAQHGTHSHPQGRFNDYEIQRNPLASHQTSLVDKYHSECNLYDYCPDRNSHGCHTRYRPTSFNTRDRYIGNHVEYESLQHQLDHNPFDGYLSRGDPDEVDNSSDEDADSFVII